MGEIAVELGFRRFSEDPSLIVAAVQTYRSIAEVQLLSGPNNHTAGNLPSSNTGVLSY